MLPRTQSAGKIQSLIGQDIERSTPRLSVSVMDSAWIEGLLGKKTRYRLLSQLS
jgi:hypothetical protein